MGKTGRRFAREYFWFALTLIAVLLGSAARAGALDGPTSGNKKPTTEELEQRIAILEQKLEAQQQAIAALLQAQRQPALVQRAEAAQAAQAAAPGEITAARPPPPQTPPHAAQAAAPQAIAPVAQATTPATHPVTV